MPAAEVKKGRQEEQLEKHCGLCDGCGCGLRFTNTVLVLGGIYLFFGQSYAVAVNTPYAMILLALCGTVLTNGVPEAVLAGICAPAVCLPVKRFVSKEKGRKGSKMMLLAIDVGNTNIKMGLFSGGRLINSWRLATDRSKTGDEYGVALQALLMSAGLKRGDIDGVIMSSVVPGINFTLEHMLAHYLDKTPMLVGPGIRTGLNIKLDSPRSWAAI